MKFIHTSDWHLGRMFGPVSLRADQEAFTDWFVDLAVDEAADMVVIAGDLYDRAVAPTDAIELFRDTIDRLLRAGIVVAAITGNHDGADRVASYGTLLDTSGFYLRGGYPGVGEVITHEFTDGPLDLVLLPYLEPRLAADDYGADDFDATSADQQPSEADADDATVAQRRRHARTHRSVLATATGRARTRLRSPRSVAVSHAFVTGGAVSDSERLLSVGGTAEVGADVYDGFSYVALGHLHRPQDVARGDGVEGTLRYSGTPLAYSYSEEHPKSVTIVDIDATSGCQRRIEPVGVGRGVRTLTDTIDALLTDPSHASATGCFVRAVVTDPDTVLDAKARLATRFPYVTEVVLAARSHLDVVEDAPDDVARRSPLEVTRTFWEEAEGSPADPEIDALLTAAVGAALESATDGGA